MGMKRLLARAAVVLAALGTTVVVSQTPALADGAWYIWDAHSSHVDAPGVKPTCVDVPNSNFVKNTVVKSYPCHPVANERWDITHTNNQAYWRLSGNDPWQLYDIYTIDTANNQCLTDRNNGTTNGSLVILYDCNGGSNQEWLQKKMKTNLGGNDYYWLINVKSARCLAILNPVSSNYVNNLIQYDCNTGQNELWTWSASAPAV